MTVSMDHHNSEDKAQQQRGQSMMTERTKHDKREELE